MTQPIDRLLGIMARLRSPDHGCPWDLEQSFATIAPYTIEEAYEIAEAIDQGDMPALRDELGDLLFQVVFHARMAEEAGAFAFGDVVESICRKMVRRHPHVFGDERITTAEAQTRNWEELKAEERAAFARHEIDVPLALPALMRAEKIGKRAARTGFDWPDCAGVIAKIREELDEIEALLKNATDDSTALEEEIGDLLFAAANLARHLDVQPEEALRKGNAKFQRRFKAMEAYLKVGDKALRDATLDEMESAWTAVKRRENS